MLWIGYPSGWPVDVKGSEGLYDCLGRELLIMLVFMMDYFFSKPGMLGR